jgi:hypothetical protein
MQDGQTMAYVLKIWANGAARMTLIMNGTIYDNPQMYGYNVAGQWYTLNSFSLNIVPNSGEKTKWAYYLVSSDEMSIIGDANGNDGPVGRFERMPVSSYPAANFTAPPISSPKAVDLLVPANTNSCDSLDIMTNPPENYQDNLLVEGTANGWWQNNASAGGTHHYRKDFNDKPNNARFVVYDLGANTSTRLAEGEWFTVGNTFLRIKQKDGSNTYNFDYLYTVSKDGKNFRHISFQEYEPGDFRMFAKTPNNDIVGWFEPGSQFYHQGHSTYLPPIKNPSSEESDCGDSSPSSSSGGNQPSSSSGGNRSSSSSANTTPINAPKAVSGPLFAYATGKTIVLENVPSGAKVEIYNLRGEQVHSGRAYGIRPDMGFMVQTKGVYFVKVNSRTLRVLVM